MINPLPILKKAVAKVPFVKYALGIVGVAAAAAIIKSFNIENNNGFPIISILVMLGLMVLLFLFSILAKSNQKPLAVAGYILVYIILAIVGFSGLFLTTSVFFNYPKPISKYNLFKDDSLSNAEMQKRNAISQIEKLGFSWVEETKSIKIIQAPDFDDITFQSLIPQFLILKPEELIIAFSQLPSAINDNYRQNQLTSLNGLEKIKSLRSITVNYSFHLIDLKPLSDLKQLESLDLRANFNLQNIDGIQDLTSLTSLNLKSTFNLQNLNGLENLKNLLYLNLSSCKALTTLNALVGLKKLNTLDLSVSGLPNILELNQLVSLTNLDMHSCAGVKSLEGMAGLEHLLKLDVGNCPFLEDINDLKGISSLTWLNLGQCGSLKNIDAVKNLTNLTWLSLTQCQSLENLDALKNLKNLKTLFLQGCNKITVKQVEALHTAIPMAKIVYE
jgi:uncharacterized membrane protein YeaQ/YmgE (transglycosylase-associated protein family)